MTLVSALSPILRSVLRHYLAAAFLAVMAIASFGQSARIGGETSAVLQMPAARTAAVVMLATPLVLGFARRKVAVRR